MERQAAVAGGERARGVTTDGVPGSARLTCVSPQPAYTNVRNADLLTGFEPATRDATTKHRRYGIAQSAARFATSIAKRVPKQYRSSMRRFLIALIAGALVFGSVLNGAAMQSFVASDHQTQTLAALAEMQDAGGVPMALPDHDGASFFALLASACCDRDGDTISHGLSHCHADCAGPLPRFGVVLSRSETGAMRADAEKATPSLTDSFFRPPIG
ncbi:hypothetical protein [Microbaculum marinisediminis]|uniref:DUF2946 domain-containing protein n=1 Tax=Microbaculum marinisediminis TaxID=2931392 RepID=A0AAW5QVX0_9HYPH|nr:hypothetical protein [Microbaculum sp. A6E488]MCT8971853.1 hypothetical protein [Microbaculum sp. A6E488]